MGKFQGVIRPTTPTGSRVTSTPTPGRTEGTTSPPERSASPAKNLKMLPARATSPIASGSVLPSSRASRSPSSLRRARISLPAASRMSKRCCGVDRPHAAWARVAAAVAWRGSSALPCAYSPAKSRVSEGLMLRLVRAPSTHSPAMRFLNMDVPGSVFQLQLRIVYECGPALVLRARVAVEGRPVGGHHFEASLLQLAPHLGRRERGAARLGQLAQRGRGRALRGEDADP